MRIKAYLMAGLGALFLCVYAPTSSIFIAFVCLLAVALTYMMVRLDRKSPIRKWGPYALLLNLLFVDFHSLLIGNWVETVGVSFSVIRIFMTMKQAVSQRTGLKGDEAHWICVSGFYLPALIVGPVFSGLDLRNQTNSGTLSDAPISETYRLLLLGLVAAALLSPAVKSLLTFIPDSGPVFAVALIYIMFAHLFFAFWGQSLIAEMTSRIIGFSLPQNFDKPWLAKDIRDFWQRWHRSMAQFVMQYIFLPLNLAGISPKLATIAAFVFMGLWHNLSLGYFIWGVAHGLLMAYWPKSDGSRLAIFAGRISVYTLVPILSFVANYLLG